VNPGAVGRSLDGDTRASYAVLETANRQVHFFRVAYDIEAAVRDIERSGMPLEIATLVRHGARRLEEVPSAH
jgi:diadenosine tetraphosphatase ApaH/serine/threonine PP2A family protein phosphatase